MLEGYASLSLSSLSRVLSFSISIAHTLTRASSISLSLLLLSTLFSFGFLFEIFFQPFFPKTGTRFINLPSGIQRKFLQDGDTITFKGKMSNGEYSIGFGECTGTVLPAHAHLAALVASEADL